jgi:co-chaperonin GroES (HSP10)
MSTKKKPMGADLFDAGGSVRHRINTNSFRPLRDTVWVRDMDFSGRKLSSGIIVLSDDGKAEGIRPRWARVYAVGPKQKEIQPDKWVFVEHGRWSRGVDMEIDGEEFTMRQIDPDAVIFMSDEQPDPDETMNAMAVSMPAKTRD